MCGFMSIALLTSLYEGFQEFRTSPDVSTQRSCLFGFRQVLQCETELVKRSKKHFAVTVDMHKTTRLGGLKAFCCHTIQNKRSMPCHLECHLFAP